MNAKLKKEIKEKASVLFLERRPEAKALSDDERNNVMFEMAPEALFSFFINQSTDYLKLLKQYDKKFTDSDIEWFRSYRAKAMLERDEKGRLKTFIPDVNYFKAIQDHFDRDKCIAAFVLAYELAYIDYSFLKKTFPPDQRQKMRDTAADEALQLLKNTSDQNLVDHYETIGWTFLIQEVTDNLLNLFQPLPKESLTTWGLNIKDWRRLLNCLHRYELSGRLDKIDILSYFHKNMSPLKCPLDDNFNQFEHAVFLASRIDRNQEDEESLFYAVELGDTGWIKELAKGGIDVNVQNSEGQTPLHVAVIEQKLNVVQTLLREGADVNVTTASGYSPLHLAAMKDDPGMINFLLDNKSLIAAQDNHGNSPLHLAAAQGAFPAAENLIKSGAPLNLKNSEGKIPARLAKENRHKDLYRYISTEQKSSGKPTTEPESAPSGSPKKDKSKNLKVPVNRKKQTEKPALKPGKSIKTEKQEDEMKKAKEKIFDRKTEKNQKKDKKQPALPFKNNGKRKFKSLPDALISKKENDSPTLYRIIYLLPIIFGIVIAVIILPEGTREPAPVLPSPSPHIAQPTVKPSIKRIKNFIENVKPAPGPPLTWEALLEDDSVPFMVEQSQEEINETLKTIHGEYPHPLDRLMVILKWRLGTPYESASLGEGTGIDPDPLFRLDKTDGTVETLVDYILARTPDLSQADELMIETGYWKREKYPRPSFESRYHFTSHRIYHSPHFFPLNEKRFPKESIKKIGLTLNQKENGGYLLDIDWSLEQLIQYTPTGSINQNLLNELPRVCGIAFIRENYFSKGLAVGHEGFLVQGKILVHASSVSKKVIQENFDDYLKQDSGRLNSGALFFGFNFPTEENRSQTN